MFDSAGIAENRCTTTTAISEQYDDLEARHRFLVGRLEAVRSALRAFYFHPLGHVELTRLLELARELHPDLREPKDGQP
jgi:hypothetical protein